MNDPLKWYAGSNGEFYSEGPFDTREEALAAGESIGRPFHIIEANQFQWSAPDASEVIDRMIEDNHEYAFEDCDVEFDDPLKEAEYELQGFLNGWLERHRSKCSNLRSFNETRNHEIVGGEHD